MSGLEPYRRRLDELDNEIARLFGERFDVCREIARYKREHDIPMMQPHRVEAVRARYLERGGAVGLPAEFCERLFEVLIDATCRLEDELMESASSWKPAVDVTANLGAAANVKAAANVESAASAEDT